MKTIQAIIGSLIVLLAFPAAFALDGEIIPREEAAMTAEVTQIISKTVISTFEKEGKAFRDAHRKPHGCVNAQFKVLEQKDPVLKTGLFAKPAQYSAMIRFSNGSGDADDDHKGDGRGMAIKIFDVPGKSIDADPIGKETQDFIMINHPIFFVRNAKDYLGMQRSIQNGTIIFWFLLRPFHEFAIANTIRGKEMRTPLNSSYWSMTPYKFGDTQMKYSVAPCAGQATDVDDSKDFLAKNLAAGLSKRAACFKFLVQLRNDPKSMPIEDATIEWSEKKSPYQEVARVEIPAQTPKLDPTCEKTAFNPWHSLPEHRPLGGISRMRRAVYQEISRLRNELNAGQ